MLNLQQKLKTNLTIDDFLDLILSGTKDLGGNRNYVIVTADAFNSVPQSTSEIIDHCKDESFIQVKSSGKKCYELHITPKGVGHLKSLKLRRGVTSS